MWILLAFFVGFVVGVVVCMLIMFGQLKKNN